MSTFLQEQDKELGNNTRELLTPPPEFSSDAANHQKQQLVHPTLSIEPPSDRSDLDKGQITLPRENSDFEQDIITGKSSPAISSAKQFSDLGRTQHEQSLKSTDSCVKQSAYPGLDRKTSTGSLRSPEIIRRRPSALSPASVSESVSFEERLGDVPRFKSQSDGKDVEIDDANRPRTLTINAGNDTPTQNLHRSGSRPQGTRALTTPMGLKSLPLVIDDRKPSSSSHSNHPKSRAPPDTFLPAYSDRKSLPMPPLSLSTFLQLELASQRPSEAVIHRHASADTTYESSEVKLERLINFITLPMYLEGVLWYGTFACIDAWLHTFTILPLRMLQSLMILLQTLSINVTRQIHFANSALVLRIRGSWQSHESKSERMLSSRTTSEACTNGSTVPRSRHRRTRSIPSTLTLDDKADLLKGLLIVMTCAILLRLDASRMYHWVRGQAAIKLYVIYNLLEVCDRMLSAIGQDVLECLFSQEALGRKLNGHSKIIRPFWLFILALLYCVCHSTALFYQVITLNVAVNSYSNALITLLMSNQFVEIKSTIFKKFEKENLFQMTCADVVERFQLWHMLMIIASRNIVETGALNFVGSSSLSPVATATTSAAPNMTHAVPPLTAAATLPRSFTFLTSASWLPVLSQILGPFIIVMGSEMIIDFLKHAYVNKFNNVKPKIYSRFLDILAKDYYTNAFQDQNLIKRIGLPVIPLSCLMIRAGFQTYEMLLIQWDTIPSTATLASLQTHHTMSKSTPTTAVELFVQRADTLFNHMPSTAMNFLSTSTFTTGLVLLLAFLIALVVKLILGMLLLAFSRARYKSMRHREGTDTSHYTENSKRSGPFGSIEIDNEKREVIYEDDSAGLAAIRKRESRDRARKEQEMESGYNLNGLDKVNRYDMVAKRIW